MGSVSSGGVSVGVQYLGEGGVSWTDVVGVNDVGVKGCAMRRSLLRGVGLRDGVLQGV